MVLNEIFRVVSRFHCYISCYIAENRFFLGQCIPITTVWAQLSWIYRPLRPRVLLLYLYSIYSAICRPSDRTVGRPPPGGLLYRGRDTDLALGRYNLLARPLHLLRKLRRWSDLARRCGDLARRCGGLAGCGGLVLLYSLWQWLLLRLV